ncbi:18138_t:CDS:2, partial [Racocetra persica]
RIPTKKGRLRTIEHYQFDTSDSSERSTTVNLDETYGYHRTTCLEALGISKRAKASAKKKAEETEEPKYEECKSFIILQLGIALFRFGTFTAFVIIDSKTILYLFIPNVAFLIIPTVINLFMEFGILFSDQSQNGDNDNKKDGEKNNDKGDKKDNENGDENGNEKGYQKDIKEDDKGEL